MNIRISKIAPLFLAGLLVSPETAGCKRWLVSQDLRKILEKPDVSSVLKASTQYYREKVRFLACCTQTLLIFTGRDRILRKNTHN